VTKTRLPRWQDEAAVSKRVRDTMADYRAEIEMLDAVSPPGHTAYPDIPEQLKAMRTLMDAELQRGWLPEGERAAVAAALRGDIQPLVDLIAPEPDPDGLFANPPCYMPGEVNPMVATLSPATWNLICEFLTGQRNPRTGRCKGERGRPKMTAEARRKQTPTHDAADEFLVIRDILRRLYPEQSAGDIRDRAEEIAKKRTKTRIASLQNYRKRGKASGHKP
jgi:hypothetical protein